MPDERKKKEDVVVEGGSSTHMHGSGAAPDFEVPLIDHFLLIYPFCMRLLVMRRRGNEWDTKGRRRYGS